MLFFSVYVKNIKERYLVIFDLAEIFNKNKDET